MGLDGVKDLDYDTIRMLELANDAMHCQDPACSQSRHPTLIRLYGSIDHQALHIAAFLRMAPPSESSLGINTTGMSWSTYIAILQAEEIVSQGVGAGVGVGAAVAIRKGASYLSARVGPKIASVFESFVGSQNKGANALNKLQDLTPDQLSYRRLLGGVDELDVRTGRNQSVFYSGRGAREAAEKHAASNGLTTLEQTNGGKYLDDLRLFDGTVADVGGDQAANVWGRISSNYASQASGDVTAIVNNPRSSSIFLTQELPVLLQNPNVTQVTVRSMSGAQVSIPRGTSINDALKMIKGF